LWHLEDLSLRSWYRYLLPDVIDPPTIPEKLITPPVSGEELRQLAIIGGGDVAIGRVVGLVVASGGALASVLIPLIVGAVQGT
jgi:hypothetical protein